MAAGVLVLTADHQLAAGIARLGALAGFTCVARSDSAAAASAWRSAPAVLVGADLVATLAAAGLPRRDRVSVVATDDPGIACWQAALALGADRVLVLGRDNSTVVDALRSDVDAPSAPGRVLGVVGGCGGAGASTFASALAISAAAGGSALLVDGDLLGGGLDILIGAESQPGVRWPQLAATRGRLDPSAFAAAICSVAGIGLLSWGRDALETVDHAAAVDAVIDVGRRAFDTVVIDISRGPSPFAQRLLDAVDLTVVVLPAEVRAVAATAALLSALGSRVALPRLVVRDAGGHALSAKDVGASLGLPVVATYRSEAAVHEAARRGDPPVRRGRCSLRQACELVLEAAETAAQPVLR